MSAAIGRLRTSAVLGQLAKRQVAPYAAMIEIADRCNEVCVHCYQVQGEKGEMTTEQLLGVIDELADMGVLMLTISGGEPTLRRDFLDIVRHARRRRFAVTIFTNGLSMTPEMASDLATLAVHRVQISLYSHRAEVHDWVTGVDGSFDRTVAGIGYLVEQRVSVLVKAPLMSVNASEQAEYTAFVGSLGCDCSLIPDLKPREDGTREPETLAPSAVDRRRLMSGAHAGPGPRPAPPEEPLSWKPCGACAGNVHIEPHGEIRPCSQLDVPVGSALEEGVRAAWEDGDEARAIRELTWDHLHGCRECDLRRWCSRCFASAQAEGGDPLGPYDGACTSARLAYEAAQEVDLMVDGDRGRGPYEAVGPGRLAETPDRLSEADRERRRRYGWFMRSPRPSPPAAQPGELVQIRRPGRRSRLERVPDGGRPREADVLQSNRLGESRGPTQS